MAGSSPGLIVVQHTSYADCVLLKNRDLFSELKCKYIYSKATAAESMLWFHVYMFMFN